MASAVMFLVIEAMRKAVSAVTGRPASRSAMPIALVQRNAPLATSPNIRPGTWCFSANFSSTALSACVTSAERSDTVSMDAPDERLTSGVSHIRLSGVQGIAEKAKPEYHYSTLPAGRLRGWIDDRHVESRIG